MALNETPTSNLSVIASLEQKSLTLLQDTRQSNLIASILCLIAAVANALVLATIGKTKTLHNKSQYVIFSHSLAECLFGVLAFANNFRKYFYAAIKKPDVVQQVNCIFMQLPLFVVSKVALYAILALCFDRLLAVGAPIKYKTLRPLRYVVWVNAICWGAVMIHVPFLFLYYTPGIVLPVCQYAMAVSSAYRSYETTESSIVPMVTIVAYSSAIGLVSFRYWGKKWQNEAQRSTWTRQVQMGAFKMMMTVGCVYSICWGVSTGINYVMSRYASPIASATFGPYLVMLQNINAASHFFVYFGLSKRFRKAFYDVFCCRKTTSVESLAK